MATKLLGAAFMAASIIVPILDLTNMNFLMLGFDPFGKDLVGFYAGMGWLLGLLFVGGLISEIGDPPSQFRRPAAGAIIWIPRG